MTQTNTLLLVGLAALGAYLYTKRAAVPYFAEYPDYTVVDPATGLPYPDLIAYGKSLPTVYQQDTYGVYL